MCPNMRQDVSQAREEVSVTETAVCKAPWWRPFMVHYMILPISHEVASSVTSTLQMKELRVKELASYPGCKSQVLLPQEPRAG